MDRLPLPHALHVPTHRPFAAHLPPRRMLARLAALMLCGVPLAVLAQAQPAADDAGEDAQDRPTRRRAERNPVRRVLFSSFIIQ